MHLLNFFRHESATPKLPILAFAILSGLANSFILASINAGAEEVGDGIELGDDFFVLFLIYLVSVVLFIYTRKTSLSTATEAVEEAVRRVRLRIVDKLRHADLHPIESLSKTNIHTYLTQDTNLISQSAVVVLAGVQSAIVLFFCLLYIGWLSMLGFVITVVVLSTGVLVYGFYYQILNLELHAAARKEAEFFSKLAHVLDGFKELKLNRRKSDDVFAHMDALARDTEQLKVSAGLKFVINLMFSRVSSNILLGIVVFVLPFFSWVHVGILVKISATILFLMGPLENIVAALPVFMRANVAVKNLQDLEAQIDHAQAAVPENLQDPPVVRFESLVLERISFHYTDRDGQRTFSVGPLDLTLRRGELLYIVGNNGSGKSTLLKLLSGLYPSYSGTLLLDDEAIEAYDFPAYRELFAVIFADFHLFDRLYGLPEIDMHKLKILLKMTGLADKTRYQDGAFTELDLSTGQRKRLALVAALLEDKPIYIFDELAADQDPGFRHYFYTQMLPDLRHQGKTIIAVSHDEAYFATADRVLEMRDGRLQTYRKEV